MVSSGIILGQNYFVSNLYNNLVFSNPSIAAYNEFSLFQLNYRNQWPIDGLYNTYSASFFHSVNDLNSNFGAIINYDSQYKGVFNTISVGGNYAYRLQTSRRGYLLFGIAGFYNYQSLNYSNLSFEDQNISLPENQSRQYPVVNSGISLIIYDNHLIGLSVVNLYPFVENSLIERSVNLSYIGRIEPRGYGRQGISYIEPVFNLLISTKKQELLYGANLGIQNFKAGVLFNQTALHVNSIAILLGISFDNYDFIYSYDLNLSTSVSINPKMAAHEVTFLRKFQYKGRRKRKGAIKCPDI